MLRVFCYAGLGPFIHKKDGCFPLAFLLAACQYVVMVCTYCRSATQVTNSRLQKRLNQVWRRRRCRRCGACFTTHEKTELNTTLMVRHNKRQAAPFDRDKLFISVYESCKHRTEAINNAQALTQTIIAILNQQAQEGLVDRDELVTVATQVLGRYDAVAATMYGAYHAINS